LVAGSAVASIVGLIAIVNGRAGCGAPITHLVTRPTDEFGNVAADCMEADQHRWLVFGIAVTVAATGVVSWRTTRSRQRPAWIANAATTTIAGSTALIWAVGIGALLLAERGGVDETHDSHQSDDRVGLGLVTRSQRKQGMRSASAR
jgi:hypothetical protein